MAEIFPSLPDEPKLGDVFRRFSAFVRPLLEVHDIVLRGESELTVGERELIAAYVSSLNACMFCFNGHEAFARAHGIAPDLIAALLNDIETADIDDRLRPLLAYVEKLTRAPSRIVAADAEAVFAQGWSEEALFSAVQVCALFNFMNRIVEGTGVTPFNEDHDADPERPLPRMDSYLEWGRRMGMF